MKIDFGIGEIKKIVEEQFLPKLKQYSIFTFEGPLGAGKTTLIKQLLKQCGVTELVTSPTFTYLNTYTTQTNMTFHHFDLYRMQNKETFVLSGFEELLQKSTQDLKTFVLIEWPKIIEPLLSDKTIAPKICKIILEYQPENLQLRRIELSPNKSLSPQAH